MRQQNTEVSKQKQIAKLQGGKKTRTVERPRAVCKNFIFPRMADKPNHEKILLASSDSSHSHGKTDGKLMEKHSSADVCREYVPVLATFSRNLQLL